MSELRRRRPTRDEVSSETQYVQKECIIEELLPPLAKDGSTQSVLNLLFVLTAAYISSCLYETYERTGSLESYLSSFWDLFLWLMYDFEEMLIIWLIFAGLTFTIFFLVKLHIKFSNHPWMDTIGIVLYYSYIVFHFSTPTYLALIRPLSYLMRLAMGLQVCVLFFKMHSYYWTNRRHRIGKPVNVFPEELRTEAATNFPNNVTAWDYFMFLNYPTLVYQLSFERTRKIRWWSLAKYWCSSCLCFLMMYIIVKDEITPVLSLLLKSEASIFERLIQLGIPVLISYLLMFFGVFHSGLSGLAEITRFAVRDFYSEWWNSNGLDQYWSRWNRVVYKWMLKHSYVELQQYGFNKTIANMWTIIFTAILHEYVCRTAFSQPLLHGWMFYLILITIPATYIMKMRWFRKSGFANLVMWIGFTIDIPSIVLLYSGDFVGGNMKK